MLIVGWIALGLVAGYIASRIVNRTVDGIVPNSILGVAGALAGGFLFQKYGMAGVSGVAFYSILVAVTGAIVALYVFHAIMLRTERRPRSSWH